MPNDLVKFLNFLKIKDIDEFSESNIIKVRVIKKENKIDIDISNPYPYSFKTLHELMVMLKEASDEEMIFNMHFFL